jgi:hypothetical protein
MYIIFIAFTKSQIVLPIADISNSDEIRFSLSFIATIKERRARSAFTNHVYQYKIRLPKNTRKSQQRGPATMLNKHEDMSMELQKEMHSNVQVDL